MTYFCFEKYVNLHVFSDDSGIALYNGYSGDTFFLRSVSSDSSILSSLQNQSRFSPAELSLALGINEGEASQALDFLLVNRLVANVSEI